MREHRHQAAIAMVAAAAAILGATSGALAGRAAGRAEARETVGRTRAVLKAGGYAASTAEADGPGAGVERAGNADLGMHALTGRTTSGSLQYAVGEVQVEKALKDGGPLRAALDSLGTWLAGVLCWMGSVLLSAWLFGSLLEFSRNEARQLDAEYQAHKTEDPAAAMEALEQQAAILAEGVTSARAWLVAVSILLAVLGLGLQFLHREGSTARWLNTLGIGVAMTGSGSLLMSFVVEFSAVINAGVFAVLSAVVVPAVWLTLFWAARVPGRQLRPTRT